MNERDKLLLEEIAELKKRKLFQQQKAEEEKAEEARRNAKFATMTVEQVLHQLSQSKIKKKTFKIVEEDTADFENVSPKAASSMIAMEEKTAKDALEEEVDAVEVEIGLATYDKLDTEETEEEEQLTEKLATKVISMPYLPQFAVETVRQESKVSYEPSDANSSLDDGERRLRFGTEEDSLDTTLDKPATINIRFEYARNPKTCERYLDVEQFSRLFIDDLTEEALSRASGVWHLTKTKVVEGITYTESKESSSSSLSTYVCIFEWPTIADFTVEIGANKLDEFISYWKFTEDWKHCINFLYGESDAACDYYRYEAIFGIPCKQYPIPQATASVFFTFEISRIRPRHCLVDMYYWFEGQRMKHTPGKCSFQEDRLFNVVDAKLNFYKSLTY